MADSNVTPLFPISGKGKDLKAQQDAVMDNLHQVIEAESRWKNLVFSRVNPDAPREWWQWGRRPTRLVCCVTIPGARVWLWDNVSETYDEDENDLGSSVGVEVLSEDIKPTRRAQPRYIERAERDLIWEIERAKWMVADLSR